MGLTSFSSAPSFADALTRDVLESSDVLAEFVIRLDALVELDARIRPNGRR